MPSGGNSQFPGLNNLAYIVSRFPDLTETFILREIWSMYCRGWAVVIFSLFHIRGEPIVHPEAKKLSTRVIYTPFLLSKALWRSLWFFLRNRRKKMLEILCLLGFHNKTSLELYLKTWLLFPKAILIAYLMEKRGIQHIHVHWAHHPATVALIVYILTGITYSFTAHAHDLYVNRVLLPVKIDKARFVVTIANYNINILREHATPAHMGKIHLIYNSVDLDYFSPVDKQPQVPPLVLAIGRLIPMKGFNYLVKACSELHRQRVAFQCVIVGSGPELKRLRKMIAEEGLKDIVRCVGPKSQQDIKELLQRASLFVMPSIVAADGSHDGLPTVLMEALAMQVPSVATKVAGIPEIIDDNQTGTLVPPGDVQALSEMIKKVLSDKGLSERLAKKGRERVEDRFSLGRNIGMFEKLVSHRINDQRSQQQIGSAR
jgi:colanic acid/amylovoran biosynthesis glycosyltransferase